MKLTDNIQAYVYNAETLKIKIIISADSETELLEKVRVYYADKMLGLKYSDLGLIYTEETEIV